MKGRVITSFVMGLVLQAIAGPARAQSPEGDRALLSPTALVAPARSVTISSLEGVLVGLTFAPLPRAQVSAVLLPSPVLLTGAALGVKLLAHDGAATKVALLAQGAWFQEKTDDFEDSHRLYLGGAAVTRCWDVCRSSLSGFAASGRRSQRNDRGGPGHSYTPITFGANGLVRLAGNWSFVLDLAEWGRVGCKDCVDQPLDKLVIAHGLRYSRERFGATLGLATGVDLQALDQTPFPLPLLTVAYRLGGATPPGRTVAGVMDVRGSRPGAGR